MLKKEVRLVKMVKRLIQSQDFNGPWVTELQLLNGS